MEIIDAEWEKRNLGVSCYEFVTKENDTLNSITNIYNSINERQYNVVRVPSSRYDIADFFQNNGYKFIEAAITLKHNLKNINISPRIKNILNYCSYIQMNEEDATIMENEIDKNIFKTDRISLDPHFTASQAANRYKMWLRDLTNKGIIPFKVLFRDEIIGFFLNKELNSGVFDGILAATYSEYEDSGMGIIVQYAGLLSAIDRNAKEYIGHISGNNPKVMKVLTSLGFEVIKLDYIFIKHC